MDDVRRSDSNAVAARLIRQFVPSRIERQLLAQVFDLVSRGQASLSNVSAEWSEHCFSAAPRDVETAADDARALSRRYAGRGAA
jgi:hypothetical protein